MPPVRALLLSVLFLASAAHADVVTLEPAADATLLNEPQGLLANGAGPVMIVGRSAGSSSAPVRRSLVRFDVASALPAGAVVNSVALTLDNPSGNTGPFTVELHRVLASWSEGPSSTTSGQGAPSQPGDVTWLHRDYPNVSWATPGGDFDTAVSTELLVDPLGVHTWPSTPLAVADVQGWLDAPASNFGWLLKLSIETTPQSTKVFATREAATASERPRLVIDFDPPAVSVYCSARTNSLGCTPAVGWSGLPSASPLSSFSITLAHSLNQRPGLLVYGLNGPAALPQLGGLVCVAPPLRRSPMLSSGGAPVGLDCSGAFSFDFGALIASGSDPALVAGALVHAQWLVRDPGNPAGSFNSSDALRFTIAP